MAKSTPQNGCVVVLGCRSLVEFLKQFVELVVVENIRFVIIILSYFNVSIFPVLAAIFLFPPNIIF